MCSGTHLHLLSPGCSTRKSIQDRLPMGCFLKTGPIVNDTGPLGLSSQGDWFQSPGLVEVVPSVSGHDLKPSHDLPRALDTVRFS